MFKRINKLPIIIFAIVALVISSVQFAQASFFDAFDSSELSIIGGGWSDHGLLTNEVIEPGETTVTEVGGWRKLGDTEYEWYREINIESNDIVVDKGFNEQNKMIGFEYKNVGLVSMTNSYNKRSLVMYYRFDVLGGRDSIASFNVRLGGATGYGEVNNDRARNMPIVPFIQPVITIKPLAFTGVQFISNIGADFGVMPSFSNQGLKPIYTLNFRYDFK